MPAAAEGTNRLWGSKCYCVECVFLSTNSEITGVWKTQQFSLHGWPDKLHLRYSNTVKYWDHIFRFSICSSVYFQLTVKCSPTHLCPAHVFLLSPIPHVFAIIANYSHHPHTGGKHINNLHFLCFCPTVVIGSWWIYTLSNLIISY